MSIHGEGFSRVAIHGGTNRDHLLARLDAAMDVERGRSVTTEEVNDE